MPNNENLIARIGTTEINPAVVMMGMLQMTFDVAAEGEMSNLYRVFSYYAGVRDKIKIKELSQVAHILQSKKGCKEWIPRGAITAQNREIIVDAIEIMIEQCPDVLNDDCVRSAQGAGLDIYKMEATDFGRWLQGFLVETYRQAVRDDFWRTVWYGDKTMFGDSQNWWFGFSENNFTSSEQLAIRDTYSVTNGIWTHIKQHVSDGETPYVDAYNGGVADPTNPLHVRAYLDSLHSAANPMVQSWTSNANNARPIDRAMYLVSAEIWDAYYDHLVATGTEAGYRLMVDGNTIENVLLYKGRIVLKMDIWTVLDSQLKLGNQNIRAIYTIPSNLAVAFDIDRATSTGSSLVFQVNNDISKKGIVYGIGAFKLGTGIRQPELLVASWNSVPMPQ